MGWKTRKDKLQSDQPDAEATEDEEYQGQEPEIEADASAMARLAQLSADPDESPSAFDIDKDSFRTDAKRTSLDPSEFAWFNDGLSAPNGQNKPRPAPTPVNRAPAYAEPTFEPAPFTPAPAPSYNRADFQAPEFGESQGAPSRLSDFAEAPGGPTRLPEFGEDQGMSARLAGFGTPQDVSHLAPSQAPAFEATSFDTPSTSWPDESAPPQAQPAWALEPAVTRIPPPPQTAQAPPPAFSDPSPAPLAVPAFADPNPGSNGMPASTLNGKSAPASLSDAQTPKWAQEPPQSPPADAPRPSAQAQYQPPTQNPPSPPVPSAQYSGSSSQSPYATQPSRPTGDGQNINSFSRDSVAAGLVAGEGEFSIPKVAPFIVSGGVQQQEEVVTTTGDHYLILRIRNLSSSYKLTNDVTTIGRPDSITKNYPDVEIDLDDGVSRKHAEIRRKDGLFYVVDVGSTNGTLLNGDLMEVNLELNLSHGDRIRVGEKTEIVFE